MATGGDGSENQIQLGYGSCIWGTRSSTAGVASDQDELHQSESHSITTSTWTTGSVWRRDGGGNQVTVACINGRARRRSNSACGPWHHWRQIVVAVLASWGCWQHPVNGRPLKFNGRIWQPPYRYNIMSAFFTSPPWTVSRSRFAQCSVEQYTSKYQQQIWTNSIKVTRALINVYHKTLQNTTESSSMPIEYCKQSQ